jgi:hypothetical protein
LGHQVVLDQDEAVGGVQHRDAVGDVPDRLFWVGNVDAAQSGDLTKCTTIPIGPAREVKVRLARVLDELVESYIEPLRGVPISQLPPRCGLVGLASGLDQVGHHTTDPCLPSQASTPSTDGRSIPERGWPLPAHEAIAT